MAGIGNIEIDTYFHPITLLIGTKKITTFAYFSDYQSEPLLGRGGFFQFFKEITFKEKQKQIELI